MKKLFTIIALAVGMMLPMQAQNAYIYKKDGSIQKVPTEKMYFNTIDGEEYLTTDAEVKFDAIAGDYVVYATSGFTGSPESWELTITRDENDANKVWFHPFMYFSDLTPADKDMLNPIYGIFDEANGTVTIPAGQCLLEVDIYRFVIGYASTDDKTVTPQTTGNIVASVVTDGFNKALLIENMFVGVGDINDPDGWWYQAVHSITIATNYSEKLIPVTEIDRISTTAPEIEDGGILSDGAYTWSFAFTTDGENYSNELTTSTFAQQGIIDLSEIYGASVAGYMAKEWSVSGLLVDAGLFDGGQPAAIPGYSYSVSDGGVTYNFLDFADLDSEYGYCSMGKAVFTDQNNNELLLDMNLADVEEGSLSPVVYFTADGDEYKYDGVQLCIFYVADGVPYLYAYLNDVVISKAAGSAAPKMSCGKIEVVKDANKLGASQKLNFKTVQKARKF